MWTFVCKHNSKVKMVLKEIARKGKVEDVQKQQVFMEITETCFNMSPKKITLCSTSSLT